MRHYLNAADAFLFASKSETQGIVLLEAMAAGCPVAAVSASGVVDVVRQGINGYMTEEDPEAFAAAAARLVLERDVRSGRSEEARKTAELYESGRIAALAAEQYGLMTGQKEDAVIVTSDGRGDCIENIIKRCNGKAIRVPDGCRSRDFLRNLIEEAGCPGKTLAATMDGPLGPRRVPKTLGFYLAEKGKKNFIEVQAGYSRAVCLNWRWDHYRIPLPFTSIKISLKDCGITGDRNAVLPG